MLSPRTAIVKVYFTFFPFMVSLASMVTQLLPSYINESFLHDLLEIVIALGPDAPVLILGDINIEPQESPVLSQEHANGLIWEPDRGLLFSLARQASQD